MAKIQSIKKRKNDGFRNGIFSEESSNLSPKRYAKSVQGLFSLLTDL